MDKILRTFFVDLIQKFTYNYGGLFLNTFGFYVSFNSTKKYQKSDNNITSTL